MSLRMSISLDIKNIIQHMYLWLGSACEPTWGCLLGWDSLRPYNTSSLPRLDSTPASSPGLSSSPSASVDTLSCSRCWFCRQTNACPLHRVAPHRRCGSGHTFPAMLCSLYYRTVAGWFPVKHGLRCLCMPWDFSCIQLH